jgi:hypothetical protein
MELAGRQQTSDATARREVARMLQSKMCLPPRAHKRPRLAQVAPPQPPPPPRAPPPPVTPPVRALAVFRTGAPVDIVPRPCTATAAAALELVLARPAAPGYSADEWDAMSRRLLADPETCARFWRCAEPAELFAHMQRFYREAPLAGDDPYFRVNWRRAADEFGRLQESRRTHQVAFGDEQELGFRGAVRAGRFLLLPEDTEDPNEPDERMLAPGRLSVLRAELRQRLLGWRAAAPAAPPAWLVAPPWPAKKR